MKAVVLRVNSPGGSAVASAIIGRELDLTKEVKPVIVSMGNYAASGGYWISANADYIFADPPPSRDPSVCLAPFLTCKASSTTRWG